MPVEHRPDATEQLNALLHERILVIDGAMGTLIQTHGLTEADYRGERWAASAFDLMGDSDLLLLSPPDLVRQSHRHDR